jgi:hypothetical protein
VGEIDALAAEDPYLPFYLHAEETGISPEQYDRLARVRWGVAMDAPARVKFIAWSLCEEAREDGHTVASAEGLVTAVMRAAHCPRGVAIEGLRAAIAGGGVRGVTDGKGAKWCGIARTVDAEEQIAADIARRLKSEPQTEENATLPLDF